MHRRISGIVRNFLEFNTRLSSRFSRTIGLSTRPTHINASLTHYIDAIKHAMETLQKTTGESRPLAVLDVGCGQTSLVTREMKNQYSCRFYGMDLSAREIELNSLLDERIVYDTCNPGFEEDLARYAKSFDLIISHTFLEHVGDPRTVHHLIGFLLRDDGMVVHLYPTLFDPFMTLNHVLPDRLTKTVLMALQPSRTETGKFRSYYKYCRACSPRLRARFKEFGFRVLSYRNFYGSHYLYRFFPLQACLDGLYLLMLKLDLRMFTSRSCVVLVKASRAGRGSLDEEDD